MSGSRLAQPVESTVIEPLVRDLVEWIVKEPRPYREVLDAWRTSCPRLMVWETAAERGFVERKRLDGQSSDSKGSYVIATEAGRKFVQSYAG